MHSLKSSYLTILVACLALLITSGCSTPRPKVKAERKTFAVARRQLPPEATYNRLRWGVIPETKPARSGELDDVPHGPLYLPVIEIEMKNINLDELARALATVSRYRTYVASTVSEQRLSIQMLGG